MSSEVRKTGVDWAYLVANNPRIGINRLVEQQPQQLLDQDASLLPAPVYLTDEDLYCDFDDTPYAIDCDFDDTPCVIDLDFDDESPYPEVDRGAESSEGPRKPVELYTTPEQWAAYTEKVARIMANGDVRAHTYPEEPKVSAAILGQLSVIWANFHDQ